MYGSTTSGLASSEGVAKLSDSVNTPRKTTDIEHSFNRLSDELEIATKRLLTLKEKLTPVMAEVPVNPESNEKNVGSLTALAREVDIRTEKVRVLNWNLGFILDSLQL